MSLVVNTNVSSLTAQRALAETGKMLDEAMARLSSGSRINAASDDAAGLAIVQRMTAQINGLNMAVAKQYGGKTGRHLKLNWSDYQNSVILTYNRDIKVMRADLHKILELELIQNKT